MPPREQKEIENHLTGETKTVAEWAKHLGISYNTMLQRVNKFEQKPELQNNIFRPLIVDHAQRSRRKLTNPVTGECKSILEWSNDLNVVVKTMYTRYQRFKDTPHLFHKIFEPNRRI